MYITGTTKEELQASYTAAVTAAQAELQAKIAEAQMSGDFGAMQSLCVSAQSTITEILKEFQEKIEALNSGATIEQEPQKFYNYDCGIDLDAIVYDGDRDMKLELDEDPDIQTVNDELKEKSGEYNARKNLLKTSLKLTEKLAPHIYKIAEDCRKVLKMDKKIEFYVYQDDKFNAACYPPTEDKLYIIISSGIIERFSLEEIAFVIGHEIGHVLFEHHTYSAKAILAEGEGRLSPLHAMKLFAWGRAAEISCDRIGLLCCKSFTAAGSAFFKLSSGVTSTSLQFNLDEYIAQFVDLKAEMASSEVDPEDWYSSHPFSPIRIKALELFGRSDTYYNLVGKSGTPEITEAELEQEIAQFMSLMNPSYLDKESEVGAKIQQYIFVAGYLIAKSDGTVDQSEVVALGRIVTPGTFRRCMREISQLSIDDLKSKVVELSSDLNAFLSPMQKLNILRDLTVISSADGTIDKCEIDVLYHLCHFFNINYEFIDSVIEEMTGSEE